MGIKSSEKAKAKHKKGLWSPEEDQRLKDYVLNHGHGCWSSVAINAGLKRNGKSCRLRWINYLRPGLKRGMFTKQEEDTILSLHRMLGNKWSQIAQSLPGRTDNEIKNYWHSYLKKKHAKIDQETYTFYNTPSSSSSKDMDFSASPVNNPSYESLPQMAKSSNHTNQSYLIPRKPLFAEWVSLPDRKVNGRGIFVNADRQLPDYKDGHLINDNISNLSVHDYVFMHDNYSLSEGEINGDQLNDGVGYNNDNSFDGLSSSEFKFEDQISGISFDSVCGGFNNMNNNDVIFI